MIAIEYRLRDDFKSYFKNRVENIVSKLTNEDVKLIVVTAGPYRPYGAAISWIDPFNGIINIDWYSALRTGFGNVTDDEIICGINNNEINANPDQIVGDIFTEFVKPNFNEKTFEAFTKYCKTQIEGKYNMYTQAVEAAQNSGLSLLAYGIIQIFFKELDELKPDIRKNIEKDYMEKLMNNPD